MNFQAKLTTAVYVLFISDVAANFWTALNAWPSSFDFVNVCKKARGGGGGGGGGAVSASAAGGGAEGVRPWGVGDGMVIRRLRSPTLPASNIRELCAENRGVVVTARSIGVTMAMQECEAQFMDCRWNCTIQKNAMRELLNFDTRESGFVRAIIAAGTVHSVAEECASGRLIECGCVGGAPAEDTKTDDVWEWGGCNDEVKYAYEESKILLEVIKGPKISDFQLKIRRHNIEAGRLAVKLYMVPKCKCHGLSGSCTLKTCWNKMAPFNETGSRLKDRFDGAVAVTIRQLPATPSTSFPSSGARRSSTSSPFPASHSSSNFTPAHQKISSSSTGGKNSPAGGTTRGENSFELMPVATGFKPHDREDIVYERASPDYCKRDVRRGLPGTRGRTCDPDSMAVGGCSILCCGRGYRRVTRQYLENCQCKFKWCCDVICKTCPVTVHVHVCK